MSYTGIYGDGWMSKRSQATLPGGKAGKLVIRAHVLPRPDQHLEVVIEGRTVVSEPVPEGPLELRIPVPAATAQRTVELRWAGATRIAPNDPREAAALLQVLNVVTATQAPASLRLPGALANFGVVFDGIFRDGWVEREASVVLRGGPVGQIVIRGRVFVDGQDIEVSVDGELVEARRPVGRGTFEVRAPITASSRERRVELRWGRSGRVGQQDPREAAAFLSLVGVATGTPPAALQEFSHDLLDPDLVYDGIHGDGWVQQEAHVVLAGGPPGTLVVRGRTAVSGQRLNVVVDGRATAAQDVGAGPFDVRAPVPDASAERRVELRWAKIAPVGESDPREAAALLSYVGVVSGRPPAALQRFPADLLNPNVISRGIFLDGWLEREAFVVLAGGPAGELVLRGWVSVEGQSLEVAVNDDVVTSDSLPAGQLEVRAPVPESQSERKVALRWSDSGPVGPGDPREAAAHLQLLAISPSGKSLGRLSGR